MQDNILQALIYPEMTQIRAKSSTDLNQLIKKQYLNLTKKFLLISVLNVFILYPKSCQNPFGKDSTI